LPTAKRRADWAGAALAVTIPVHLFLVLERCVPHLGRAAASSGLWQAGLLIAFGIGLRLAAVSPFRTVLILALPGAAALAWVLPGVGLSGLPAFLAIALVAAGMGARLGIVELPVAAHLAAAALGLACSGMWLLPRFDLSVVHAMACGVDVLIALPFLVAGSPERPNWGWPSVRTSAFVCGAGMLLGATLRLVVRQEVLLLGTPAAHLAWPLLALLATGMGVWLARAQARAGPPVMSVVAVAFGIGFGQGALPGMVRFVDRVQHIRGSGGFDLALALLVALLLAGVACAGLGALAGRELRTRATSVLWFIGIAIALVVPLPGSAALIGRAAPATLAEERSPDARRAELLLRLLRPRAQTLHQVQGASGWEDLFATEGTYELLLASVAEPWRHGGADGMTRELLASAQARLAPGGVLALRFTPEDLDEETREAWLHTLLDVFAEVQLWVPGGAELLFVVAREPILRPEELVSAQFLLDSPAARDEALLLFGTNNAQALFLQSSGFAGPGESTGEEGLGADQALRVTLAARDEHFRREGSADRAPSQVLFSGATAEWTRTLFETLGGDALAAHRLTERYAKAGRWDLAYVAAEYGLALTPGNLTLEGDVLLYTPAGDGPAFTSRAIALIGRFPLEVNRVAVGFELDEQYERALYLLEGLSVRLPDSATVWANLAVTYHDLGRSEDRDRAMAEARAIDPVDASVLRTERVFEREARRE